MQKKSWLYRHIWKLGIPGLSLSCGFHYYFRWSIFSLRIFLRTRFIKLNGGKAKPCSLLPQGCRNASVAMLTRSGFHAIYRGNWWQSFLDANRSRVGCPICAAISWKTKTCSFHSEFSLAFRDSQSACTFRALERYSADITICLLRS